MLIIINLQNDGRMITLLLWQESQWKILGKNIFYPSPLYGKFFIVVKIRIGKILLYFCVKNENKRTNKY